MKRKLLIVIFFLLPFCVNAQREAYNLVYGICTEGDQCLPPFSTGVVKFNDDSIESISLLPINGSFQRGSTSISDSAGNLLLAFNGKYLYKPDGGIVDTFFYEDYNTMTVAPGHGLILKPNTTNSDYFLFNTFGEFIQNHPVLGSYDPKTYLTTIKKSGDNFEIISKSQVIIADSSSPGNIVACRHANGRDWWVLRSGIYKNEFFLGLLSPSGIEMNPYFTSVAHEYQSSVAFNFFSSDGSKFFHFAGYNDRILWEYNFDRCTGALSNPIEHDFSLFLDPQDVPPMCLSPDGKLVYIRRTNVQTFNAELYQYNILSNSFYMIDIGTYGPILTPNLNSILSQRYVPDSSQAAWGENWLDVVNSPNIFGVGCNFENLRYNILSFGLGGKLPNYANYHLGPIDGSICDSLGIDNPVVVEKIWEEQENKFAQVFPNPFVTELNLRLQTAPQKPLLLQVHNTVGQLLWQSNITQQKTQIPIAQWSKGLYLLRVLDENGKVRFVEKLVCNE